MSKMFKQATKFGVIVGIPILATSIIGSLLYYISIWYAQQKVFVINIDNIDGITPLIICIFLSSMVNIGLTIYFSSSQKRICKLMEENIILSELVLQQTFKTNEELIEASKKVGAKVD